MKIKLIHQICSISMTVRSKPISWTYNIFICFVPFFTVLYSVRNKLKTENFQIKNPIFIKMNYLSTWLSKIAQLINNKAFTWFYKHKAILLLKEQKERIICKFINFFGLCFFCYFILIFVKKDANIANSKNYYNKIFLVHENRIHF